MTPVNALKQMRLCVICGGDFTPSANKQNACSEKCRKERQIETKRKRVAKNPEKYSEQGRAWRANNPEKCREKTRRWRMNNPEKQHAAQLKWSRNNRPKKREIEKKYRAKLRAALTLVKDIESRGLEALL